MSPRWTSYVVPKPTKGLKNAKCPKFEQKAAITAKRYDIGCQLLLITNRKSHMGFRLVATSMTLNDLEQRNSIYFSFFLPNSIALQADYVSVVKDRPYMSVKYCLSSSLPLLRKLTHPAARSLCDSWTSCLYWHSSVSNLAVTNS